MPTLKELRKRRRLSQDMLAQMSNIYRETICRIEIGIEMPNPYTINKLAEALRVKPEMISCPGIQKENLPKDDLTSQQDQLELFVWEMDNEIRDILHDVPDQMISKYFGKKKIVDYILERRSR